MSVNDQDLQKIPYEQLCPCVGVALNPHEAELSFPAFELHMRKVLSAGVRPRIVNVACPICRGTGRTPT